MLWQGKPVRIRTEKQAIRTWASRWCRKAGATRASASTCGVGLNLNLPIYDRLTHGRAARPAAPRRSTPTGRSAICASRRASRATRSVASLSGGNQQKIVVGKWLNHGAELFIFDEPTVGVDVGTKVEIYRLMAYAAEAAAPASS